MTTSTMKHNNNPQPT